MLIDEKLIKEKFTHLITKENDNIIFKSRKSDIVCTGCERVYIINLTEGDFADDCNYSVDGTGDFKYVLIEQPDVIVKISTYIKFEAFIEVKGDDIIKITYNTIYLKD